MENVIRNDSTYIETYIKNNVGRVKSNPVFQKIYVNEWDNFFVSFDETYDGTARPTSTNNNLKIAPTTSYAFIDAVVTNDNKIVFCPYNGCGISNRQAFDIKLNKSITTPITPISEVNILRHSALILNPLTNKLVAIPFKRPELTTSITEVHSNLIWFNKQSTDATITDDFTTAYGAYNGGVYDPKNKRIWFTPNIHDVNRCYSWSHFHYYDCVTEQISHVTLTTDMDGVANSMQLVFNPTIDTSPFYTGGCFVDNKVYFFPVNAMSLINTGSNNSKLYYLDVTNDPPTFKYYSNTQDGISNYTINVTNGYIHEYSQAVLYDKKIYFIPFKITNTVNYNYIQYLDTTTNLFHKIPNNTGHSLYSVVGKYSGGCLAPDGYIYMSPVSGLDFFQTESPYLHRINVITNTLEVYQIHNNRYYRYNSSGTKNYMLPARNYFTKCLYSDGKIYFILNGYSGVSYPNINSDYPFQCYLDLNLEEDKKWNKNIHLMGC